MSAIGPASPTPQPTQDTALGPPTPATPPVEAAPVRATDASAPTLRPQAGAPGFGAGVAPSPHDAVSEAENLTTNQTVDSFRDWARYPYQAIVVPGYTPLDAKTPVQMHPIELERLQEAKKDFDAGKAPFILVSGGAAHPPGTPFFEAIEMKKQLVAMGVPADRIIVDAAAQHSTTNLRNAGRYMLEHGMTKALVTTSKSQSFYYAHQLLTTFELRSRIELGYKIGKLSRVDSKHTEFTPSADVKRINRKDAIDP